MKLIFLKIMFPENKFNYYVDLFIPDHLQSPLLSVPRMHLLKIFPKKEIFYQLKPWLKIQWWIRMIEEDKGINYGFI